MKKAVMLLAALVAVIQRREATGAQALAGEG